MTGDALEAARLEAMARAYCAASGKCKYVGTCNTGRCVVSPEFARALLSGGSDARGVASQFVDNLPHGMTWGTIAANKNDLKQLVAAAITAARAPLVERVRELEKEIDELFLFKQNMRLRNDPQYEAQAAIERAEAAEARIAALEKVAPNACHAPSQPRPGRRSRGTQMERNTA